MPRKGNNCCCVVGCNNKYGNTSSDVSFYSFPPDNYLHHERRKKWIQAVRRKNKDNTLWKPSKFAKICSIHFLGGKKSMHPHSPAYAPSIFPWQFKRKVNVSTIARLQRIQDNNSRLTATEVENKPNVELFVSSQDANTNSIDSQCENSCQTDFMQCTTGKLLVMKFDSNRFIQDGKCEVDTQTTIEYTMSEKKISDKSCGVPSSKSSNCFECGAFHGIESIKDENKLKDLTGVTFSTFRYLLELLPDHPGTKLSAGNELLIFLMRVKCNLSFHALSALFQVNVTTVSGIFLYLLKQLAHATEGYIHWVSKLDVQARMPECFKKNYPDCRVIIDCTELEFEQPDDIEYYLYPHYKGTYTAKILIGFSPEGTISFRSKVYDGRNNDPHITLDCGILEKLEPGDKVLAQKGFPNIKTKDDVIIVMPPKLHDEEEILSTYDIGSVRIHVERVIQRLKIYNILKGPINFELFKYIDDLVHVCCVLTNFQTPIIQKH